jgi:hypothetical protein
MTNDEARMTNDQAPMTKESLFGQVIGHWDLVIGHFLAWSFGLRHSSFTFGCAFVSICVLCCWRGERRGWLSSNRDGAWPFDVLRVRTGSAMKC